MIPFSKTTLGEEEKRAVAEVIDSGWVVQGPKVDEFEARFAEYVGAKHAVFVDSGTSALFLACQYERPQNTLKVPSLTFCATAEAAINAGVKIEFMDVSLDDFCLIEGRSDAMPVHLMGNRSRTGMIYDSAHRIEKGDLLNAPMRELWCYSFYATKNMTTVTGGMIATNNPEAAKWLKTARDHGLSLGTKERYQGRYKQYDVGFVGWRVKADDLRAAVGLEQLKKLPEANMKRNILVERYNWAFRKEHKGNHLYPVLVEDQARFMDYMFEQGIQCAVHFRPLHLMTAYQKIPHGDLSNTEYVGKHIVSLPLFPQLNFDEQDFIIKAVLESKMLIT